MYRYGVRFVTEIGVDCIINGQEGQGRFADRFAGAT